MSVAKRADTYGIHHWQILWNSYRILLIIIIIIISSLFNVDVS